MDFVWEDFSHRDYHTVPILCGEQVNMASNDVGKKPQFVMGNAVGESREICDSRSSNVLCRKEAGFCYPSEERSTTEQEGIWSHPFKEISITSHDYVEGGTSSADNPILGASNTAYECNAGGFSLPVMSSADGGLILMQNGYNHIENDILCYDLPDIGNFDDIDGIFRNYDSTFGQGSSTLDELSRFSMSSPGVNGPEDPNHFLLPEASSSTQTFEIHEQPGRFLLPRQDLVVHTSTSSSSQRDNRSSSFLKSPDIILKEMMEELFPEQNLISAPTMKQQPELLLDTNSVQKQNHKFLKGGENEIENAGLNLPTVAADFSPLQKNFYMASSFSEEMSNSIILQQLQGVMDQLNVRMKECVRDSLYRLAGSAGQRRSFLTNNSSKDSTGMVLESQDLKRCAASASVKTETNPIDRSIAHLLFHRPTEGL